MDPLRLYEKSKVILTTKTPKSCLVLNLETLSVRESKFKGASTNPFTLVLRAYLTWRRRFFTMSSFHFTFKKGATFLNGIVDVAFSGSYGCEISEMLGFYTKPYLSLPVEDLWLPFDTVFNETSTITCLTHDSWSYAQLVDFMNTCTIDHDAVERKCSVATLSSDMAEMIAIAALMIASVARLVDGEAVDVPSNIQRHAFKNTPEEAGQHPVNMQIPWAWTVSLEVQPPFLSPVGLPVSPFFLRSYHGKEPAIF